MSLNSFGHLFRVTTWGESHGPALGATVDGCPPGVALEAADLQVWLDKRKPGQSKHTTQRKEPDAVEILSGVFEGRTTGTPIQLTIRNTDQRSKDYGEIAEKFRPGHADITYWQKYGIRDYRGGGRSSARETAARVAAGGVARAALAALVPGLKITGYMTAMGPLDIDRDRFDWDEIGRNDFWCPDAKAARAFAEHLDWLRKDDHNSVGAVIECVGRGVPAGLGAPVYGKLDTDLAAAMMSINAVKGVEIGEGMAAARLTGRDNADEISAPDRMNDIVEYHLEGGALDSTGRYVIRSANDTDKERWFETAKLRSVQIEGGDAIIHVDRAALHRRGMEHEALKVVTPADPVYSSNHAGGVLGGISTGQDVVVRFAVKPTSSILSERRTITKSGEETTLVTKGRHDPCVGIRAVPVAEAMMACVLLDHLLLDRGQTGGVRGPIG